MPYNEGLIERIREALSEIDNVVEQKKFGGISFMVNDKMCVRANKDDLMLRCEPEMTDELLTMKGARRFEMKGKTQMKGWLLVNARGTSNQKDFDFWMKIAVDYNKKAGTADKRKKK